MKSFKLAQVIFTAIMVVSIVLALGPVTPARAATTLTVTPITWNVIGLDSNNVNVGPNHFPIGIRVCNIGGSTAAGVSATFKWDTTDTYINIRPGTYSTLSAGDLAASACADLYFEVEVTRTSSAYNHTARYHIELTADAGATTASSPTPRELYVERLISQNRNNTTDIQLSTTGGAGSYTSIVPGGTMTLMVGQTYWIKLIGFTATNGYEQIETFVNMPNTIFQVLSVDTTYTQETSGNMAPPYDRLYGDGCTWENNPTSANYRSCLSTGKAGGDITVTYKVKIISIPNAPLTNPEDLTSLIYDFSGSSYHYNADFSATTRYVFVVDPTIVGIVKSFSPNPIGAGGLSTLSITLSNPTTLTIGDINFTDTLPTTPGNMVVAATPGAAIVGCGTPTFSPTAGAGSLSFSNGTIAPNSSCVIKVNVTAPTNGTYHNVTNHLYVGSTDTGKTASADLVVNDAPIPPSPPATCSNPIQLAKWDFSNYTASTSTNNGPFNASTQITGLTGVQGKYNAAGTSASGIANNTTYPTGWNKPDAQTPTDSNSWGIQGGWPASGVIPTGTTTPSFQFSVGSVGKYGGIGISANYDLTGNWSQKGNWYVFYSTDGTNYSLLSSNTWDKGNGQSHWMTGTGGIMGETGNTTVDFKIILNSGQNDTATLYVDDVTITGCLRPDPPTVLKSFSPNPVAVGANSTLTLTVTNPNPVGRTLNGISISDYLPADLLNGTVSATNGSTAVVGTGTAFTKQLIGGGAGVGSIINIPSTHVAMSGTSVSVTNGSNAVVGTGTRFSSELSAGTIIELAGVNYTVNVVTDDTHMTLARVYRGTTNSSLTSFYTFKSYTVASITDDTHLTLTAAYGGSTASGVPVSSGLTLAGVPTTTCGSKVAGVAGGSAISLTGGNLTGTLAFTNGSTSVTGTGTAFTSELGGTNNVLWVPYQLTGTIGVTNGLNTVTGTGTLFTTELTAGKIITINSVDYIVAFIASNTSLELNMGYAGTTQSGLTARGYREYAVASVSSATSLTLSSAYSSAAALSGLTIKAGLAGGATCTITTPVKANMAGTRTNITGAVTAAESGENTALNGFAQAPLTGVMPPVINKSFEPASIPAGGVSTLVFSIQNINVSYDQSGVAFIDNLPTIPGSMVVATPPNASTSGCGSPTFSPAAGAGSLTFSGGTIAAGGICTVKVNVTASTAGTYNNTSGVVSHVINAATVNGNTASASLIVVAPLTSIDLTKQVSKDNTNWTKFVSQAIGGSIYYKFSVYNSGQVTLTSINVTDTNLAGLVAPSNCTWPASLAAGATATCSLGPIPAVGGVNNNTATAHGTYNSTVYNSNPSTATYDSPTITTTASPTTGTVGTALTAGDSATLAGAFNPTGSVTFALYNNSSCSGAALLSGSGALSGLTASWSGSWTPTAAGSYYWKASYPGDANNNPVSACGGANEVITIAKASPGISTTPGAGGVIGVTLNDQASLSGGYSPTGSVTFKLFPPGDATCNGAPAYTEVDNTAPYGTTSGFASNAVGTWHWTADYSGDGNNNSASSGCAAEPVTVSKASPAITTSASPTIGTIGISAVTGDTATLSGGYNVGGSVTFSLYSDSSCTTSVSGMSGSGLISANSASWSASWTPPSTGNYYWKAGYAGDSNNNGFTTTCGDANEQIIVGLPASIGDYVWLDLNNNGIQDSNEPGIRGATVKLYTSDGLTLLVTTTTGTDGSYSFTNLTPGSYIVEFSAGGAPLTEQDQGDDTKDSDADASGRTGLITVTSGQDQTSIDAGFYTTNLDMGDLPQAPYYTLFKPGPAHIVFPLSGITPTTFNGVPAVWLGAGISVEPNGQPQAHAQLDTYDDGLVLAKTGWKQSQTSTATITVNSSLPTTVYFGLWIDWNHDGTFDPADFYQGSGETHSPTDVPVSVTVPATYGANTDVFMRLRASSSPLGFSDYDGTLVNGEVEDYWYQFDTNGNTTPVTVAYFLAQKQGNNVNFAWSTATETGNVGFNLYVKSGNKLTRINSQLIPSKVIDSLDRQDYTFSTPVNGTFFYIEDVSVLGETRQHGPFQIGMAYGALLQPDKIDWASIQAEHNTKHSQQQAILEGQMNVPAAALKAGTGAGTRKAAVLNTPAPTKTFTPNKKSSPTKIPTSTKTIKLTYTFTRTPTSTFTWTNTIIPSSTPTATFTLESTATDTVEPTATSSPELTSTLDPTATDTVEPTATYTVEPTATDTAEPTATLEPTSTFTLEPTATFEPTSTFTLEPTATDTATDVPTLEPTATVPPTPTPVAYATPVPVDPASLLLTNTFNMKVRQTGIYRVTYEMLKTAGLDLAGVPASKITVLNRGNMMPDYVYTPDSSGVFGAGGYIEFYGEALDTLYTDTNIYTIQISNASVPQIPSLSAAPAAGQTPVPTYSQSVVVNNQKTYSNSAPGNDPWYDTSMLVYTTPKSWNYTFQVDGLLGPAGVAQLEVVVWGATDWPASPDHHVKVCLNGVILDSEYFDGITEKKLEISVPAGVIVAGKNTLTLTLPGDSGVNYELVDLDRYTLTYARAFLAQSGRLTFGGVGNVFSVANLPSNKVNVYRMRGQGLARLTDVQVQPSGSTYTVSFGGTDQADNYLVTDAGSVLTPTLEATRPVAKLDQPAQYLIISYPDFISGLQPLVAARQAQGLTVSVVNVNDLYNQFTYGVFDPLAIKQYIAYAAKNLGTQYVLLVGGDTYDYRNYLGKGSLSFIPSLYISTGPVAKFIPSDPLYTDLNGDNVPDLAIGRLPVKTTMELTMVVDKTLAYSTKGYGQSSVFATDVNDGKVSYKAIGVELAGSLPSDWTRSSINLDDVDVATAKANLLAAMNGGTALVNFVGHSGPTYWTFNSLFNTTDAAALTNVGKPFVVVQWGCWNTYYVDPVNNYLVQKFLFSGENGAAAVLGASTLADSGSEEMLGLLLTPQLANPGETLGQAVRDAKLELARTHPEMLDVLLGWSLMGDPTLTIQP